MNADRNIQIIATGVCAAHGQMFHKNALLRPEYPRDFMKLYGWSEDALFCLLNSIKDKKLDRVREDAGSVIVLMSEIIEYAEELERLAKAETEEE